MRKLSIIAASLIALSGSAFAGELDQAALDVAKTKCGADPVVWVNQSKVFHFAGYRWYGTTKSGAFACEKDAVAAGDRAATNEKETGPKSKSASK
jgi:hypothetical protein